MNESFCFGNSFFHHLEPRAKLITAFTLSLYLALTNQFAVAGSGILVGLLFIAISRVPLSSLAKRLAAINTFTLFLWLTLPLTYGGPLLFDIGPFHFSREGVRLSLLIALKTNAIVLINLSLLATSTISNLGHAMNRLHLPAKFCYLLLYSYRYIYVIHQEYSRLLRAVKIRCFVPKTSIHTYRTFGYLFGMTIIKSWNHSQRVNQAMQLRGFNGHLLPLDQPQFRRSDYFFLFSIVILLLIFFTTDYFFSNPAVGLISFFR